MDAGDVAQFFVGVVAHSDDEVAFAGHRLEVMGVEHSVYVAPRKAEVSVACFWESSSPRPSRLESGPFSRASFPRTQLAYDCMSAAGFEPSGLGSAWRRRWPGRGPASGRHGPGGSAKRGDRGRLTLRSTTRVPGRSQSGWFVTGSTDSECVDCSVRDLNKQMGRHP